MLTWLRTHQKGIFAVIAFVVIASFSLFGTYGDVGSKPINERDEVIRCLEQDGLKGWFEEGFGGLLVDGLAAEALKEKIAAFKGFKTSKVFDQVVKQFAPDYYADLLAFRGASGGINELVRLYGHQLKFSSEMVRRIAMYMGQEDPGDVTLFYARSIEDWFGQEFITGLADLVVAKTKGVPARFKWAAFKKNWIVLAKIS